MSDDVNFTAQDANNLITVAQRAPLKDLAEAQALSDTLIRFARWANSHITPVSAVPAAPSANAQAVRRAIQSSAPMVPAGNPPAPAAPRRVAVKKP